VLSSHLMKFQTLLHILLAAALLSALPLQARAEEQDETLIILGQAKVEDSIAGRVPRPLSQTPENTTVITSAEIGLMNARTLVDILDTVPGIALQNNIGPINTSNVLIQGSRSSHTLVMLDGIPYNNLSNSVDLGQIPARIIERVEIVKGAASSAWGQALGGVINVITKLPNSEKPVSGLVTYTQGERGTRNSAGELSGKVDRLGYYLSGGVYESGGFRPNTDFVARTGHAKLTYDLPRDGQAGVMLNYANFNRGDIHFEPFDTQARDDAERLILGATLKQPINNHFTFELNVHHSVNLSTQTVSSISDPVAIFQKPRSDERVTGGGGKLLWRQADNLMVLGVDYYHAKMDVTEAFIGVDLLKRRTDRWGFYLNDTYTLGQVAVSAGVRYDLTGTAGDQFSPSIGFTWQATDKILLRAYTAKGFGLPDFSLEQGSERVWTTQAGFETTAIPYLWLKGTFFRNDTWDITRFNTLTRGFDRVRYITRGFEGEIRTQEFLNTSLRAGYNYVDAHWDFDNSPHIVPNVPTNTVHLGVLYDDQKYFKALLNGRHIFWNAESFRNGSYRGLIWDLHVNATPFTGNFKGLEFFGSIRNMFNGSQFMDEIFPNSGRRYEGGVRFRF
jgi:vitamin B12 transporter